MLFLSVLISGISSQISLPYLFIYLENNLGITKTTIGLVTLVLTLASRIFAIIMGQFMDRWDRRKTAIIAGVVAAIGVFAFGQMTTVNVILMFGYVYVAPGLISGMVIGAWIMNLYPESERGGFQGMRMIFQVMLPMVFGPAIGAVVVSTFGIPTVMNGEAGFIPTSAIFTATALDSLLSLIPILLTKKVKSE